MDNTINGASATVYEVGPWWALPWWVQLRVIWLRLCQWLRLPLV
jgi:hypothetical protein